MVATITAAGVATIMDGATAMAGDTTGTVGIMAATKAPVACIAIRMGIAGALAGDEPLEAADRCLLLPFPSNRKVMSCSKPSL